MTFEEAMPLVEARYGLLRGYVNASGTMLHVIAAEKELRAIPGVKLPQYGIAIFQPEIVELASGVITIEGLVRRKHPEMFSDTHPASAR